MTVENNGVRTVVAETKLPPARAWTNDIIDKIRDSLNLYKGPEVTYASSGGLNWKLIVAGLGIGVVAILLLRKKRG